MAHLLWRQHAVLVGVDGVELLNGFHDERFPHEFHLYLARNTVHVRLHLRLVILDLRDKHLDLRVGGSVRGWVSG